MLPLETYVDTLTKLLEPQIQWSHVASILDLLSNIEFYRLLASEKVPLVLERMDHEQTEFFATVHAPEEQAALRRLFLQIVAEICTVVRRVASQWRFSRPTGHSSQFHG